MFRTAWLEKKMPLQPPPLQDQLGGGCKLANIFAQEPRRFVREEPIALPRMRFIRRRQQIARDLALPVDRKQIRGETGEKIFRLPIRQGWADPETGNRSALSHRLTDGREPVLQPRFQFCLHIRIKQPCTYRLAAAEWLALIPDSPIKT